MSDSGVRHTEVPLQPVIDVLFGHRIDEGQKNTANISVGDLATQMAASGPLAEMLSGVSETTMAGLIQILELDNDQAGYEAALTYFLDHPSLHRLSFGSITWIGSYSHMIAEAACDKTLDLRGATIMPATDDASALQIANTVKWINAVTDVTPAFANVSESDTISSSAITYLTVTANHDVKRGDVLKIYSLDRLEDAHNPVDGPGVRLGRSGELISTCFDSSDNIVVMNGRLRETYGGAGYEGTIRLAAYSMRKLEILGGHCTGNPVGIDTWRGWGHTEFVGFPTLIVNGMTFSDCYGAGLSISDCWMPRVYGFDGKNFSNSRVSTGLNRYGYALMFSAGTRGAVFVNPTGTNCRHLIDTGSIGTLNDVAELDYPWQFGIPLDCAVHGGSAIGLSNAPWGCHHNVRGLRFYDCLVAETYIGDDSGGLPLASRGTDVHFIGCRVRANRNGGALGSIKNGSFRDCDIIFGWNGISMPCAEGTFAKGNRLELNQLFNDGSVIGVGGAYATTGNNTYPGSIDKPVVIGDTDIILKGNGAVGSPKCAIFRLSWDAHVLIDGIITVDMSEYDGNVTLLQFEHAYGSFRMTDRSKIIVHAGASTGTLYRIIDVAYNDDVLVSALTRVGTVATATVPSTERLVEGQPVKFHGADDALWSEKFIITEILSGTQFTFECAGTETTPAVSSGSGIYYKRYLEPDAQLRVEYHHDTTNEGGSIDQYATSLYTALSWKRFIGGALTRDSSSFNYAPTSDGFYATIPADPETQYNFGGAGGFVGADIDPGILPQTQILRLTNTSVRALQWVSPPLFLPPKATVALRGGRGNAWERVDITSGETLLFGGFVDLSASGDQPLLPAMDIGSSGWRWNFTRMVITCRSGSFEGAAAGGIFQSASGAGQQFVAADTDLSILGTGLMGTIYVSEFHSVRHYTNTQLYFLMDTEAADTALCDVYFFGNLI